ncbi:sugar transferase [Ligilactobacillus murinus]|uniref:sugar transferase n=1 Tax=Ligilactobacillus murinus TaxID=1622 RepID=UPI002DD641BD|nr:sugar transferase [Ligilactobacillus murinus]WRY38715.1 sugar transferase [Ligilactobacillus murinus]
MEKYVISMYDKGQNEAGPKAKVDAEDFLATAGFKKLNFYFSGARKAKLMSYKQSFWDIPRQIKKLEAQTVVFQYPSFDQRTDQVIVKNVRRFTQAKLLYLIHDIESLRAYAGDVAYRKKEIAFLNQSDGLIVHNEKMKVWLKENGVIKPMNVLEIFDYANPVKLTTDRPYEKSICYAGNLQKADFLQKLELSSPLALYGPNKATTYPKNITYYGSFPPDELPAKLTQNFGLVWDGTSIERCDGSFGNYLKYNDPHKTSLYLSSGLPVIIWKEAALADFIVKNQVGLTVENLAQLDEILSELTPEMYHQMCQNVAKVAHKMRLGAYLQAAVTKLEHEVTK